MSDSNAFDILALRDSDLDVRLDGARRVIRHCDDVAVRDDQSLP